MRAKDRGKDRGKDQGKSPDKGKGPYDPGKDRPRPPGDGNELPQPGSGRGPRRATRAARAGSARPPTATAPAAGPRRRSPDLPGKGTDVTVE